MLGTKPVSHRVLLIGNDRDFRDLCGIVLRGEGINHISVSSADQAMMAIESGQRIDLIILDMMLPGMQERGFVKLVREKGFRIPIVVLSAVDNEIEKSRMLGLGANEYLVKPVSFRELMLRTRVFAQDLNALWCAACPKAHHNPGAGATVQAQFWYRDPWNTATNKGTTMSDAIEFVVGP